MKKFIEENDIIFDKDDLINVIEETPYAVSISDDDFEIVVEKLLAHFKENIQTYMFPSVNNLVKDWVYITKQIKGSVSDIKAEELFQNTKDGYKK